MANNELRQEADHAAFVRGHDMVWADSYCVGSRVLQQATCSKCGMGLETNSRPLPNETAIGGEAVALHCPGHKQQERE